MVWIFELQRSHKVDWGRKVSSLSSYTNHIPEHNHPHSHGHQNIQSEIFKNRFFRTIRHTGNFVTYKALIQILWKNPVFREFTALYSLISGLHPDCIIHLAVCLTTGPKPLHIVRSRASSFKCDYPLFSLRSSSSFLRLLPRLPVTSIPLLSFLQ
jgi:hypothetical protein